MNVLFIGNSFTARNDLPGMIARLAKAAGHHMDHKLISAGGASLRMHWNKGEALKEMQRDRYDYVVLQEQSTLPIKNPKRMHENVRLFDNAIKDTGAKTVLYMTWARAHAPESQKLITDAYDIIGRELGATVAPVGMAWQQFLGEHSQPALHDKDKSHPTLAGSYIGACVFLNVLCGKRSVGAVSDVNGISAEDAKLLQRAAWAAVKKR